VCRYKLAEKLNDRLEEMGKDLTSMIEEINNASSSLNKSTKSDDPVSGLFSRSVNVACAKLTTSCFSR
jgi:nuclear pore complex protein Nup62